MILRFACAVAALTLLTQNGWARALPSPDNTQNHIIIEGQRREARRPQRAGQSLVLRPSDETRYDTKSLLKSEANITLPETGKTTASGFTVPRVRGQDAKLTEIYIEGLRVQDPYLGYPIVDDLDLRAWGEMTLFVGNTPPAIPSVNPNGVLAYHLLEDRKLNQFGTAIGSPYGTSVWALTQATPIYEHADNKLQLRFYARQHWTKGEFVFYDDNLTPYNPADDQYRMRRHADRHAKQALPSFTWISGPHQITGISLWNFAKTSIPARMSNTTSQAREHSTHFVSRLAYTYSFSSEIPAVPSSLSLELGHYGDDIHLTDPTNAVLGQIQSNRRQIDARVGSIHTEWRQNLIPNRPARLFISSEKSEGKIKASNSREPDLRLKREQMTIYTGLEAPLAYDLLMEIKTQIRKQSDKTQNDEPRSLSSNANLPQKLHRGSSFGLAWQPDPVTFYAQIAQNERPPTLLEQFGDGGLIRDNPNLKLEKIIHREIGAQFRLNNESNSLDKISLRAAAFYDNTSNRIIMLPSIAQTMRAQNASNTQIRGIEMGLELDHKSLLTSLSYAKLEPYDLSTRKQVKLIPSVPTDVATLGLALKLDPAVLRWHSRYQSQVWRDSENTIAIPSTMIHDISMDGKFLGISLGLAIYNLSDQKKSVIYAAHTRGNKGYTSYSDYAGMPLPGRQFRLNIAYEL